MGEARAHLDLVSCVFEFEGATDFVKEELRELRDLVRAGLLPLFPVEVEDQQEGRAHENEVAETAAAPESAQTTETMAKSKKGKARSSRVPKVLKLDLTGGGKNLLEALVEAKKPSSDIDKYIVIAYWLKIALNQEEIGPDHIYTCFKALKWRVPKDIGQGFRNAKKTHAAFELGSQPSAYKLTHLGENRVEHDLPPKKQ